MRVVNIERKHSERSTYRFFRKGVRKNEDVGKSDPSGEKGLVWSGFRPSDDACMYPYHIPDNMFLVSVLNSLAGIFETVLSDKARAKICRDTVNDLRPLIEKYGIIEDSE